MGEHFDESIVIDRCVPFLDKAEVPFTKEIREMMASLLRVTFVPQDVPAVNLD